MTSLLISISIALLNIYQQGCQIVVTNCSSTSSNDFCFSYDKFSLDSTDNSKDYLGLEPNSSSNETASLYHYTSSKNTYTFETISTSSAISMVEKTSCYGTGRSSIPKTNVKSDTSDYDNRVAIDYSSSNNGYPLSAIGMVKGNCGGESRNGTIFMAPGGLGITAAHCVFDSITRTFLTNLQAGFKLTEIANSSSIKFEYGSKITDAYIPQEYLHNPIEPGSDWAVVKFADSTLEKNVGSLNIGSGFSMYGKVNTAIGFPNDKGLVPHASSGNGVFGATSTYYDLYQTIGEGMSGGPVMFDYFNSSTLEEYTVVSGIFTQRVKDTNRVYSRAAQVSNVLISLVRLLK